jgi:glycosidase
MSDPGPPRFVAVDETVQLAPQSPDPDATYRWQLRDAPAGSRVGVGDSPVVEVTPDVAGTYRFELSGPDGSDTQIVRAFPNCNTTVQLELPFAELPEAVDREDSFSVVGPFNDHLVGHDCPRRDDDRFVLDVALPPGEHHYSFCPNHDLRQQIHDSVTIPGPGRPRVRLETRVVSDGGNDSDGSDGDTLIVEADATAAPDSESDNGDLAVEFVVDDRDSLPESAVDTDERTLQIPVAELPERSRIHAVAVGERHSIADMVDVRYDDTDGIDVRHPNEPPAWAESPTVYEIFVRSFAGESLAATFEEIERRVEYLESLAVDVVWLTPVLASPTDHGYHITDYFSTASDLGDRAALGSLIDRCHDAGIRVVFDLVINHTSRDHPAFQLHSAGVERYTDYYTRIPEAHDSTEIDWAGVGSPEFYFNWERIPNLNYGSLAVRDWTLGVVDEWAGVVDGFRCDIAWGVPHSFWKEVRARVPDDFLMLDETIPHDPAFHESEFHMHYDSTLHSALREIGRGEATAGAIFDALDDVRWQGFPESAVHLRYVENHDETRYLEACGEASLRAAAAATFTLPGAPMVYYGQERGMTSQRGPMRWYDGDDDLTEFHRALAWLRREYPVFDTGDVERIDIGVVNTGADEPPVAEATALDESATDDGESDDGNDDADSESEGDDNSAGDGNDDNAVQIDDDPDRVVAFARDDGDERLLVVLNFSENTRIVSLPTAVGDTDLLTDTPIRKRYDPNDPGGENGETGRGTYVVVNDALVCRPR